MAEYKETIFNNFELKKWLHGNKNRRRKLLIKLKDDLRKLGLSRRATRAGLVQLAIKPCVILKRLPVSCCEKPSQSSYNIKQNFIPLHKEKSQSKHRDNITKKRQEDSQDIVEQSATNIPIGIGSISVMDANKNCRSKIQECNLFRKESSDDTKNFNQKAVKVSYIDVTLANYRDISTEKSNIKAIPNSSSTEDKSLKKHIHNFVHKSKSNSSCSESKTIFPEVESISISTKEADMFVNQNYLSSGNKSDTTVSIQLEKHSDSKDSIDLSKNIFDIEYKEKKKIEIKQGFSSVKTELTNTLQQDSYESINKFPENNISSINQNLISKLKTCSKVNNNFTDGNQDLSILEKSKELIEYTDTVLHRTIIEKNINQTKVYLESKNPQTENQRIETNSKTITKRKMHSESLDRNISIKMPKTKEVNMLSEKILDSNQTSPYEMLSDDELVHTNQRNRENTTKCTIKEREKNKLLKQIRERHRKENNKIKKIRVKLHKYFRGSFDPDTSESEEEHEILLNYLERNKQHFDDLLYDSITDEEVEYIFKRNKLTHNTSINNWQKDMESAIPGKIKYNNLCDSIIFTKKNAMHDAIRNKGIKNEASLDKYDILADNSQKNIERINSDDSCDSDASTEKYYSTHNVTMDEKVEEGTLVYECGTLDNSQKNIKDAISNKIKSKNSNNSSVCKEECYATTEKDVKGASVFNCDMSINSQKDINVSTEVKSYNSSNSSECTEKYCAINDGVTRKEIKNALICKNNTLITDNLQDNIEKVISDEVKSDNSCNSRPKLRTEKYDVIYTEKRTNDESMIYMLLDNSQKNKESTIPVEVISANSCNSRPKLRTEKYDVMYTEKRTNDESMIHMLLDNSQKNKESAIPVEVISANSCNSTVNIAKYATHNTTTDEKTEDEASIRRCDTSVNNSQKNIESTILAKVQFDNLCDSAASVGKYSSMYDTTKDEKVEHRASICDISANDLSENIESVVLANKQHIENFSIVDTEKSSKSDVRAKCNKGIPSKIEIDLNEDMSIKKIYLNQNIEKKRDIIYTEEVSVQAAAQNRQKNQEIYVKDIDLAQRRNVQENAISNLELPIISESTSCDVSKKESDILQNTYHKNVLTNNDNIAKDEKAIDQLSVTVSKNSSEKRSTNSLSIRSSNPSISSKSNYSDHSLENHSDDDNNSDIEVEIKIKPKLKCRVSRKFSLKAPWSAVSTCIKNLHTLKDNPSFLNEFFQMDHGTSEKLKCAITNIRPEDNKSLDDNQNVTAETDEIIYDSSPTTKDNIDSQQNVQNCLILNEDRSMNCNQKEREGCTQSVIVQPTQVTTKNNLGSSKLTCDTSNVEKQLEKVATDCKQKLSEEQNSRDNTTLEEIKNTANNQDKEVDVLSDKRKKTQMTTENNLESIKVAYNTPNVAEQLPQTSSDTIHNKVRVRSIAELSCQCATKSVNLNALESTPRSVCSAFCQSSSSHSTLQSTSFQSAPSQSISLQSVPSQSIPFQSAPLQSICPLGIPPRFASPQSTSSQSAAKQPPPSYDATLKHSYILPNTSSSVVSSEINIPNNEIQITIKSIWSNIENCRDLIRYKLLRTYALDDYIQRMFMSAKQIKQDLEKLKLWLYTNDIERVIVFVNQYMPRNQPLTILELTRYMEIVKTYFYTQILQQHNAKSNASQYPNVGGLVPNALMPNVNTQPFLRNAPFPGARMPNHGTFMQSSTMPCSNPSIPNINQQKLLGNSANYIQPHLRPSTANIRQQYKSYVSPTTYSRMPDANQQQSLGNASHLIQNQYLSPDTNIGIQQNFANTNNISSSNANMRSYGPGINQGNPNVSSTTNMRQLYVTSQQNTISNTATASITNAQQQKQMYSQTSQNSKTTVYPPPTNQNIPLGIHQTVPGCNNVKSLSSFTVNPDISKTNVANVRHGSANVNQQQTSCNPQAFQISSEKTQPLPQYTLNPNEIYCLFVPQPAHCNMQTHPVQNTLPDQNMQQKLPVNQGNANIPPIINTRQLHETIALKNTISGTTAKNQCLISKDTSTRPIDLTTNDTSQNVQQNMSQQKWPINQGNANMSSVTNISRSQFALKNINGSTAIAKKQSLVLPKDISMCPINLSIDDTPQYVQQNVLNKGAETSESHNKNDMQKKAQSMNTQQDVHQETLSVCNVLQNISGTVLKTIAQKSNVLQNMITTVSSRKDNAVLILSKSTLARLQTNEDELSNFNLAVLTDIQKIVLRDQIKSYFTMTDEQKNSLNKQEFEQVHHERVILFYLYWNLDDYIKNMLKEPQTNKKSIEKGLQDNTSQNKSVIQENTIQTSADKLTKTQFNRGNENNSGYKILEKQLEQNIDPNILKNSKYTAIKNNLDNESFFMPKSAIDAKKSLPENTRLQEQNNNIPKKQSQKSSLVDMKKGSENTEMSAEEKSITEVSAKNLQTEAQDKNQSLKAANLYDPLLTQSLSNLVQDGSTKKIEDQLKIVNNANERSSNVEMKSVRETSNFATLNSGQNDTTLRDLCNTKDQNKEVFNVNNEASSKNLLDKMCDDIRENVEILNSTKVQSDPLNILNSTKVQSDPLNILNSTKVQSDPLNILHNLEPSSLNNTRESISPIKRSTEISELNIAHKNDAETISEICLNTQQQEESMNERSDSTDEMSESGKLYIDENVESQEQCDKISSSEEDNSSISQDSVQLFETIRCNSRKVTSLLKNTAEADLSDTRQDFEKTHVEKLNKKPLEPEMMQQDVINSLRLENKWNMEKSMIQSIDIKKKHEDTKKENNEQLKEEIEIQEMSLKLKVSEATSRICLKLLKDIEEEQMKTNTQKLPENVEEEKMKIDIHSIQITNENSEQSLFNEEEIEFQKMPSQIEDLEDPWNTTENSIESIHLKLSEDIEEEKMEVDTHSSIKAINEQLKYVSEQKYYGKSRTSCNFVQKNNSLDVNEKEASVKDFLNADIIECISVKSDDSYSVPNILNIRSISPSLFEKMENIDVFLQNNSELNENDEKSLDINDNLGIPDEIDDRPCLRCKRKSMVYCQACLEAHYCSKRCSFLHWNAEHHKLCKGHDSIIYVDE